MINLIKKISSKLLKESIKALYFMKGWWLYLFVQNNDVELSKFVVSGTGKFVVYAIWQKRLCQNFLSALEILKNMGYTILVVNNSKMDAIEKAQIEAVGVNYLERSPGHGRDIAAYKLGIKIIYKKFNENRGPLQRVVLMNDSILVVKSRMKEFLKTIDHAHCESDVVGVTETEQFHHHVSSWFISIDASIFFDERFQKFWNNYIPLQNRIHSINHGEIALTRLFKKIGIAPKVIFDNKKIIDAINEMGIEDEEIYLLLRPEAAEKYRSRRAKSWRCDSLVLRGIDLVEFSKLDNQTTFWSMLLLSRLEFPFIKKDLFVHNRYDRVQFENLFNNVLLKELDPEEVEYIRSVLLAKLQVLESPFIKKYEYLSGVV